MRNEEWHAFREDIEGSLYFADRYSFVNEGDSVRDSEELDDGC